MKQSMAGNQKTVGETNHWLTPKWIIDGLGPFDLDPCAAPEPRPWPTADNHYSEGGLGRRWHGFVWMNPPYNRYQIAKWMTKMIHHGNGIAMVFARTDTAWAQQALIHSSCRLFIKGRVKFCLPDGTVAGDNGGAPSMLYGFGTQAVERLNLFNQSHGVGVIV